MREQSEFSKRLQNLREQQNRSRRMVSELCGLPTSAFGKYERGEAKPDLDSLVAIADYFEVSIDYLIGRVNDPFKGHRKKKL